MERATRGGDEDPRGAGARGRPLRARGLHGDGHPRHRPGEDLGGDYPAIQYTPPQGDFWVDVLARLGERFRYEDIEWQRVDIDGVGVRVATPRMLYRMKRDTVRLQDKADAAELKRRFALPEDDG